MKIELHVDPKFSTWPFQWVLQKIGCPESYTDPFRLREIALKNGMSTVTLLQQGSQKPIAIRDIFGFLLSWFHSIFCPDIAHSHAGHTSIKP